MAHQSFWFKTQLPNKIIDIIEEDIKDARLPLSQSALYNGVISIEKRNSENAWIPKYHWITGFLMHYVNRANVENFRYDISDFDNGNLQYTVYNEGCYYNWHVDTSISTLYKPEAVTNSDVPKLGDEFIYLNVETTRKLSVILQLSDPDDYEGGDVQFMDDEGECYFAPRDRGTVIVFDSRSKHRVRKVKKGVRKSIVGWCVGPRWK